MIILDLVCDQSHRFEGWFASSSAFREQNERALINCPHCDSSKLRQLPSAPNVRRHVTVEAVPAKDEPQPETTGARNDVSAAVQQLFESLATMAKRAEDVGERFPEEARRIHYAEIPPRNIRGQASATEAMELIEEGIMVLPAILPPDGDMH